MLTASTTAANNISDSIESAFVFPPEGAWPAAQELPAAKQTAALQSLVTTNKPFGVTPGTTNSSSSSTAVSLVTTSAAALTGASISISISSANQPQPPPYPPPPPMSNSAQLLQGSNCRPVEKKEEPSFLERIKHTINTLSNTLKGGTPQERITRARDDFKAQTKRISDLKLTPKLLAAYKNIQVATAILEEIASGKSQSKFDALSESEKVAFSLEYVTKEINENFAPFEAAWKICTETEAQEKELEQATTPSEEEKCEPLADQHENILKTLKKALDTLEEGSKKFPLTFATECNEKIAKAILDTQDAIQKKAESDIKHFEQIKINLAKLTPLYEKNQKTLKALSEEMKKLCATERSTNTLTTTQQAAKQVLEKTEDIILPNLMISLDTDITNYKEELKLIQNDIKLCAQLDLAKLDKKIENIKVHWSHFLLAASNLGAVDRTIEDKLAQASIIEKMLASIDAEWQQCLVPPQKRRPPPLPPRPRNSSILPPTGHTYRPSRPPPPIPTTLEPIPNYGQQQQLALIMQSEISGQQLPAVTLPSTAAQIVQHCESTLSPVDLASPYTQLIRTQSPPTLQLNATSPSLQLDPPPLKKVLKTHLDLKKNLFFKFLDWCDQHPMGATFIFLFCAAAAAAAGYFLIPITMAAVTTALTVDALLSLLACIGSWICATLFGFIAFSLPLDKLVRWIFGSTPQNNLTPNPTLPPGETKTEALTTDFNSSNTVPLSRSARTYVNRKPPQTNAAALKTHGILSRRESVPVEPIGAMVSSSLKDAEPAMATINPMSCGNCS